MTNYHSDSVDALWASAGLRRIRQHALSLSRERSIKLLPTSHGSHSQSSRPSGQPTLSCTAFAGTPITQSDSPTCIGKNID